jgi:prepilin-type N-terminal cleavage/methylation domain-containing protein
MYRVSPSMGKTMTRKVLKAKDGFTLVETVLSVMILGVALGACILSFDMAMRAVKTAGNQMTAVHSARDALESLRTNSFASSVLSVGTKSLTNACFPSGVSYVVTSIDASNRTVSVSVPYVNYIHRGYSTNTLVTVLSSTLHP